MCFTGFRRSNQITIKLPPEKKEYPLIVNTVPRSAEVRLFDSRRAIRQKMTLPPRRYDIKVIAKGYETRREWVEIDEKDVSFVIKLTPVGVPAAPVGKNAGDEWVGPKTGMKFVYVPGGRFEMGVRGRMVSHS